VSLQHYLVHTESLQYLQASLNQLSDPAEAVQDFHDFNHWRTHVPVTVVPDRTSPTSIHVSLYCNINNNTSSSSTPLPPTSFQAYIDTLPEITQRLLTQLEFVPRGEQSLCDCLLGNHKLQAARDGFLNPKQELASFGWQLLGNGNVLVQGAGPVDGVPDLLSSTRAKLFGVSAILEFLYHFCSYSNLLASTSRVVLWVDNRAAIRKVHHTQEAGARQ
jgi:hypothetical protein